MFKHILLCTHGTEGARKAEAFVFAQAAKNPDLKVSVLTILDEDWREMTGDDWLNSSKTHTDFLDHVEAQVSEEIGEEWQRMRDTYPVASRANFLQRTGNIAKTLTKVAEELGCDVIAIGPCYVSKGFLTGQPRKGLRDTLKNKDLHPLLPCPLLIAS